MEQLASLYTRLWSREHDLGRLACSQGDGRVCLISDQKVDCGGLAHCGSQGSRLPRRLTTFRLGSSRIQFRCRRRRAKPHRAKTPKSESSLSGLQASLKDLRRAT